MTELFINIVETTTINPGNILINPIENVRYLVEKNVYNMNYKKYILHLHPLNPLGKSKENFTISIDDVIELKYKLIRKKD